MTNEQPLFHQSSNYRPGEPLRSWTSGEPVAAFDAEFAINAANALAPLRRLIDGDQLSDEDVIAFGRLNSWCVLRWYEPLVSLLQSPEISDDLVRFLRESVPGLEG